MIRPKAGKRDCILPQNQAGGVKLISNVVDANRRFPHSDEGFLNALASKMYAGKSSAAVVVKRADDPPP
jgi:hypothetical protein